MIRAATKADIPRILELGLMLHATSSFRHIPFDSEKVASMMRDLVDGAGVVFVAERDGVVVGGLAGGITEYFFSHQKLGFDYSFFIEPSKRHGITALKLIRALEIWCKARGATSLQLGISTGLNVDGLSKFYELAGFTNVGPMFKKEL